MEKKGREVATTDIVKTLQDSFLSYILFYQIIMKAYTRCVTS